MFRLDPSQKLEYRRLTFLSAGELGTFSTNLGLEPSVKASVPCSKTEQKGVLRKFFDKFQDVRLTASLFQLFLGHFFSRLNSSQQYVELDGSRIECWLLRNKGKVLSVLLHIQFRDALTIELS